MPFEEDRRNLYVGDPVVPPPANAVTNNKIVVRVSFRRNVVVVSTLRPRSDHG